MKGTVTWELRAVRGTEGHCVGHCGAHTTRHVYAENVPASGGVQYSGVVPGPAYLSPR